jgi:hypothetical protein
MAEETEENGEQDGRVKWSGEVNELRHKPDEQLEIPFPIGSEILDQR